MTILWKCGNCEISNGSASAWWQLGGEEEEEEEGEKEAAVMAAYMKLWGACVREFGRSWMGKVGGWSYFIVYMYKILKNKDNICYKYILHRCLHIKPSAMVSGAELASDREYNSWLEKSQAEGLCIISAYCAKGRLWNVFQFLFNPDYKHLNLTMAFPLLLLQIL